MYGELDKNQIKTLLTSQLVGRLACSYDNKPYVVPIIYAFENDFIYAHSQEGMKVDIMRKNPAIAFEVDEIRDYQNWQSAVIHGVFEELSEEDGSHAIELIRKRVLPYNIGSKSLPEFDIQMSRPGHKKGKSVVFRIHIHEMSGRFEKED